MAAAAILDFIFVQYFGICVCKTSNVIHIKNFVQICAILNELWVVNKVWNGGCRHLEFIIFVDFGQMVYFRWQPSTLLQNFIHLCQLAAELLHILQKSNMAPAAILDFIFIQYFNMYVCRTTNVIYMPNFVQIYVMNNTRNTRDTIVSYNENPKSLSLLVLKWYRVMMDRKTDGQTDRITIANTHYS